MGGESRPNNRPKRFRPAKQIMFSDLLGFITPDFLARGEQTSFLGKVLGTGMMIVSAASILPFVE